MKTRILSIASTIILGFSIASAQSDMTLKPISGGVLNGKATTLAKPAYPAAARAVNAEGAVTVQILIDEQGNIASAAAVSGHPLLRQAAEQAALQSKFAPTMLSGQPVKVSGVVVYNFVGPANTGNWIKAGYDLANLEKFSSVNPYGLSSLTTKIPAEWTTETEQLKHLQTIARSAMPKPVVPAIKSDAAIRTEEKSTETIEKTVEGTVVRKMVVTRSIGVPAEASAEQVSVVQNLTSSLQSRLGNDPKAAWQFNLGVALGRAFSNARNQDDQQTLVNSVRQQIAAAPGDTAPEYLENANKIVALLESKEKTPEQRQQIGQMLSTLFKN